jgi:hypothetical protein
MYREAPRWILFALALMAVLAVMTGFGHALIDKPRDCSPLWDDWPCLLGFARDK